MKRLLPLLMLLALAACEDNKQPVAADFGNSVHHNIAIQVINPNPPQDLPDAETNGQRMNDAFDRYRRDKVKPPASETTTLGIGTSIQTAPSGVP